MLSVVRNHFSCGRVLAEREPNMKSRLYEIQDTAIQIAETLSTMLQIDVEIIDTNHMRIAGTGQFANKVNKSNVGEGHAYDQVLTSGQKLIVNRPATSEYCAECVQRDRCGVLLEVGAPIILDNKIEGVIALTCMEKERETFLMENFDTSMLFLDQMCALVSGKLRERLTMQKNLSAGKMLHTMIGLVEKGVLMLDQNNCLVEYNEIAKRECNLSEQNLGEYVNIILTGDTMTGKSEYKIIIGSNVYSVVGNEERFEEDERYGQVLVFDSIEEYRRQVYNNAHMVKPLDIDSIIGHSAFVMKLKQEIMQAATHNSPVLIEGEEGTGKKVVGTAIWKASHYADKPFVYFNCNSVAKDMLEEKIFGVIGDKTKNGETQGTLGAIELANDGILYLDEIEALPIYFQTAIEQVIKDKAFYRKGSYQMISVNVRIIVATRKNLLRLIEKQKFRKSFYYTLCACKITVQPLRKRKEDIPDMVRYYVEQYAKNWRIYYKSIDEEAMDFLVKSNWLGNTTELERCVEHMMNEIGEDGILTVKCLPKEMLEPIIDEENTILTIEQAEMREIKKAMAKYGDSKKGKEQAAEALGIGIATLYRKLERM